MKQIKNNDDHLWINAFYNPYKFWRSPFKWLKTFFQSFKIARDRIVKGWSPSDVWNLDNYVNHILGNGLQYLADNHMAYPGDDTFPNSEAWEKWLRAQAKAFQDANIDNDKDNPFAQRYWKYVETSEWKTTKEGQTFLRMNCPMDLQNKYYEMDRTIQKRKDAAVRLAFRELGEHWGKLWD